MLPIEIDSMPRGSSIIRLKIVDIFRINIIIFYLIIMKIDEIII